MNKAGLCSCEHWNRVSISVILPLLSSFFQNFFNRIANFHLNFPPANKETASHNSNGLKKLMKEEKKEKDGEKNPWICCKLKPSIFFAIFVFYSTRIYFPKNVVIWGNWNKSPIEISLNLICICQLKLIHISSVKMLFSLLTASKHWNENKFL